MYLGEPARIVLGAGKPRLPTVQQKAEASGGRSTGFDYIRIGLAVSIILWHGIGLSYGRGAEMEAWHATAGIAMHFALPMFFALSGFLVAGSLERCRTLVSFFCLRALRIIPALAVEILVSALLLGPLLTDLPLAQYFGSRHFAAYFLNIVGDIHYALPGVFSKNPLPGLVNGQLWTIPFELQCYLAIGALSLTAALRKRALLLVIVLGAQALWVWQAIRLEDGGGSGGASGPVLVIAFLAGVLFHLYRDRIRLHWGIFAAVLAGAVALSALPHGAYYLPLPCTYLTVYLGMLNPPRSRMLASGDYSYGLYLFGYPIQQAVAAAGPAMQHWWANIGLSLPAAFLVAMLSWHFVERPALGLRHRVPGAESRLWRWATREGQKRRGAGFGAATLDRAFDMCIGLCGLAAVALIVNANVALASAAAVATLSAAAVRLFAGGSVAAR